VTVGTVKSQSSRALASLRSRLVETGVEPAFPQQLNAQQFGTTRIPESYRTEQGGA
jgi:hypothetical protein